jgi:hypothetical protein
MSRVCSLSGVVLLAAVLAGCGGGGPALHQLEGEVTFNGKPVPYGLIEFEPDTSKGNSGGMGYATIRDGKYDTSAEGGRGVVGGPHTIYFTGMEGEPPEQPADDYVGPVDPAPPMLFRKFSQPHDLPQEDATVDFQVPPEAAESVKAPARPRPTGGNV